ncbi:MAG TPA: hypothetical protein PKE36_06245 [Chiayiivirga sp.]|nr:hypothetical protein [Chiayiivirga sp.]
MFPVRPTLLALLLAALPLACVHAAPQKSGQRAPAQTVRLEAGGERLRLSAPDLSRLKAQDTVNDLKTGVPLRYGQVLPARFDLAADTGPGRWESAADGRLTWRLEVAGKGAHSLEFAFSRFRLPPGASLSIHARDGSVALPLLTDADNPAGGVLHTAMLASDAAVLELTLPAERRATLELALRSVSWGYRDPFAAARAKSGSCNVDTACPEGDAWRNQIASVVGYSFSSSSSSLYCTGTLVATGSAAQDTARPRLATAYHCISTAQEAASAVFYWGCESPTCRAPGSAESGSRLPATTASRAIQTGGAQLLSTNQATDFTALELNAPVPAAAMAYYSGWDRSGIAPNGAVGIHHANGNEKRIVFNDDPLTPMRNCIVSGGDPDTHWRVDQWELGTTEIGSSGSGLWNPSNGHLIGVLSGGNAGCANPSGYDCYGRLSSAWEVPSDTGTSIRAAFDRSGGNPETMPGKSSCDAPVVTLASSAFSAAPAAGARFELRASAQGGAGGYTYLWDADGDGVYERSGSSSQIRVSFPTRRQLNVRVQVRDAQGCIGVASRALDVVAPVIEAVSVGTPALVCGNDRAGIDPGERYTVPVTLRNVGSAALAAGARALFAPVGLMTLDVGPNAFGYVGTRDCDYGFIDLAAGSGATAPLVTAVADGNPYGDLDDARTPDIALGGSGITLYGVTYSKAVMSTNGYVSFDTGDTGADADPICGGGELPAGAGGPQLRPFHADLRVLESPGAGLRYRRFAQCPRASQLGGTHPCHVFQWSGMEVLDSDWYFEGETEFQAIVYEGTGEVAYQYRRAAPTDLHSGAIGLIDAGGGDALALACPQATRTVPAAGSAMCAFAPGAQPASESPLRLESAAIVLPQIAAGQSATVNLPVKIRDDAACGAPLRLDYLATATVNAHSARGSRLAAGTVASGCQAVSQCGAPIAAVRLRSGDISNPQRSGNGLAHLSDLGATWYTADSSHLPTWYNIVGTYRDNLLEAPLLEARNLDAPAGLDVRVEQVGRAYVAPITPTRALFAWRFDDGRAGMEYLESTTALLARPDPDHTAHWYPPSQSGWGVNVESVQIGDERLDVAATYLYDDRGTPRWTISEGAMTPGGQLLLRSHRPHCPGCAHYEDWASQRQPAGSLRLLWPGASHATISTDITLPPPLQGRWQRSSVPLVPIR